MITKDVRKSLYDNKEIKYQMDLIRSILPEMSQNQIDIVGQALILAFLEGKKQGRIAGITEGKL